jgi:hypothetical protein
MTHQRAAALRNVFFPDHMTIEVCDCGCRGVQLWAWDGEGAVRCVINFTPETWLEILREDLVPRCMEVQMRGQALH